MAVLLPALTKARRQAKRIICLGNTRQLVMAWLAYADNFDGKIVNGGQTPDLSWAGVKEPFLCTGFPTTAINGFDWNTNAGNTRVGVVLSYQNRVFKMMEGALYKYAANVKMYRCSEAAKDVHRTYVMPVPMNAYCNPCYATNLESKIIKRVGQIKKSKDRIVFFEEKEISPDSVIFPYVGPGQLPIWGGVGGDKVSGDMHENGANFGFADGHSEYRKWESPETIKYLDTDNATPPTCATSTAACNDLKWMFNAIWGETR
jgi:prepilin-type processing-associated H-X9-DG protein